MSLEYQDKKIDGRVRISPSSLYTLFDNPSKWYKKNVLGQKEPTNNNLIIGSIIHNRLDLFYQGKDYNKDEEIDYLTKFSDLPEVNDWEIVDVVEETWKYLYHEYLPTSVNPTSVEEWVEFIPSTIDSVWIGGTYDYRRGNILGDFKTCNSLPSGINTHHRLQLYLYSFCLRIKGEDINEIEVTYIQKYNKGKPNPKYDGTKKYKQYIGSKKPSVSVLKEPIDEDLMNDIVEDMKNLGKKIKICREDESMIDLFFYKNYLSHF